MSQGEADLGRALNKKQKQHEYDMAHAEKRREYDRQRYEALKQDQNRYNDRLLRQREYADGWYKKNRKRIIDKATNYYHANSVSIRRRYATGELKANPEVKRAKDQRRRMRLLGRGPSFTRDEFALMCNWYENRCLCCDRDDVRLTADHVIPVSKGGKGTIGNIQPLCRNCNSRKGVKDTDYRKEALVQGFLIPELRRTP